MMGTFRLASEAGQEVDHVEDGESIVVLADELSIFAELAYDQV